LIYLQFLISDLNKINDITYATKIGRYGKFVNLPLKFKLTNNWFYISELIRTDGHISKDFLELKLTNNDKKLLIKFENFCKTLGITYVRKERDRYRIFNRTLSLILSKIFEIQAGNKSLNVYLPKWIKNLNNSVLSFSLRGAFDGDGTVQDSSHGTRRVRLSTGSLKYSEDIRECLQKFDIKSSVFRDSRKDRNVWYVEISDKVNLTKFCQRIGFLQVDRSKKLKNLLSSYRNYSLEEFRKIIDDTLQINDKLTIIQISKILNRAPSTVSDQITKLENNKFVKTERIGNKRYTSLA